MYNQLREIVNLEKINNNGQTNILPVEEIKEQQEQSKWFICIINRYGQTSKENTLILTMFKMLINFCSKSTKWWPHLNGIYPKLVI